jgi:hypothetical protein
MAIVTVESRSSQPQRLARWGRVRQVGYLEAEGDGWVVAQRAAIAKIDMLRKAHHATRVRMAEQKQGETDAGEDEKEHRRKEKDGYGEQAGGAEKASPDDSPATQDAWNVDGEARAIARALAVVAFDLAAEVTQHQCAGCHYEKAEETEPVRQASPEDGSSDEVQQG